MIFVALLGIFDHPDTNDKPSRPVETFRLMIRPSDFFTANPALDVPSDKNGASVVVEGGCCRDGHS